MTDSLSSLGVSILGGAFTTIGAGSFLFGGQLSLFKKFATLIVCTIVFATFYSLFFFSALCFAFGPVGDTGNILWCCKKCKKNK